MNINTSVISYRQQFFLGVLSLFLLACGIDNNSESTNHSDAYLERDNATIKKEAVRSIVYYKGQLFSGILVFTDDAKEVVTTLENIKNGQSLGTHTRIIQVV